MATFSLRTLGRLILVSFICIWPIYFLASRTEAFHFLLSRRAPLDVADVLLVLKTGSTELPTKLPVHCDRLLATFPRHLIFSDHEQIFAGYHIQNAVAGVSNEVQKTNKDFPVYRQIRESMITYPGNNTALSSLMGEKAWALDKWKFLPIFQKATETILSNDSKWLVLVEADSAVSVRSLLSWLGCLDHTKPLYLGHETFLHGEVDLKFAHGGSGVVLSRKALEVLHDYRQYRGESLYDQAWEIITNQSIYGDRLLAKALAEAGIRLTQSWPKTQGGSLSTIDWTDRMWCDASVFWHHVSPEDVSRLWQFDTDWTGTNVPRFSDYFMRFVDSDVSSTSKGWDNLSGQMEIALNKQNSTPEACAAACEIENRFKCVQWKKVPGHCYLINISRGEHRSGSMMPNMRAHPDGCRIE